MSARDFLPIFVLAFILFCYIFVNCSAKGSRFGVTGSTGFSFMTGLTDDGSIFTQL